MQGVDIDEEEEDAELDGADDEEEAEEEEEEQDPNRATKKQLGDTNYYCPVALKEKGVLWPGNPEVAARYREKTYYISTSEARDKFLENPAAFLPKDKPFDVRTCCLSFSHTFLYFFFISNSGVNTRILRKDTFVDDNNNKRRLVLQPVPMRILILGPKGAGKSLHGRQLAAKLGLFHIQYRDRLQELIIAKTKKKIGPEYEEPDDEDAEPEEE